MRGYKSRSGLLFLNQDSTSAASFQEFPQPSTRQRFTEPRKLRIQLPAGRWPRSSSRVAWALDWTSSNRTTAIRSGARKSNGSRGSSCRRLPRSITFASPAFGIAGSGIKHSSPMPPVPIDYLLFRFSISVAGSSINQEFHMACCHQWFSGSSAKPPVIFMGHPSDRRQSLLERHDSQTWRNRVAEAGEKALRSR